MTCYASVERRRLELRAHRMLRRGEATLTSVKCSNSTEREIFYREDREKPANVENLH